MKTRTWGGIALFLYLWLMVGFATGTATLLGPAQWLTSALRHSAWNAWEDRAMIAVIVTYAVASFLITRGLTAWMRRTRLRPARVGVPAVATLCAGLSLWGWTNPAVYAKVAGGINNASLRSGGAEFVFGAYPDRARIEQLKKDGFTGLVSLQHPAVVPFEPQGIAAEKQNAQEVGIEFIHAPMLPWVSSNDASLDVVRQVARRGSGRYYVHCGLGRDRTNVVKRMLEGMGATFAAGGDANQRPLTFADRWADGARPMERGEFRPLDKDVWLIPYPNKSELFGNMLAGQVKHVLVLLDEDDHEQAGWVKDLQVLFAEHGVPATFEPAKGGSKARAADLVAVARALPRPLVIIVPFTPPRDRSDLARDLLQEWTGAAWVVTPVRFTHDGGEPAIAARR